MEMKVRPATPRTSTTDRDRLGQALEEVEVLRQEVRVSRQSADFTAQLVVQQSEETARILERLEVANVLQQAVLDAASRIAIVAADASGKLIMFNRGAERLLGQGGSIDVRSAPGEGTTFTLWLPRTPPTAQRKAEAPAKTAAPPEAAALTRKPNTVLVIDDDPTVHDLLTHHLNKGGFEVVAASGGKEGLALAR